MIGSRMDLEADDVFEMVPEMRSWNGSGWKRTDVSLLQRWYRESDIRERLRSAGFVGIRTFVRTFESEDPVLEGAPDDAGRMFMRTMRQKIQMELSWQESRRIDRQKTCKRCRILRHLFWESALTTIATSYRGPVDNAALRRKAGRSVQRNARRLEYRAERGEGHVPCRGRGALGPW